MQAQELLSTLGEQGITVRHDGDRLAVRPKSRLTPELRDELMVHKPELLTLLRLAGAPAKKEFDLLPPEGDPRRAVFEILDEVWEAGGWLLITGDRVRAVPRDAGAPSDRLTPELLARVDTYQAELLRALTRVPKATRQIRELSK